MISKPFHLDNFWKWFSVLLASDPEIFNSTIKYVWSLVLLRSYFLLNNESKSKPMSSHISAPSYTVKDTSILYLHASSIGHCCYIKGNFLSEKLTLCSLFLTSYSPADIYLFKDSNGNTKELTIKIPERRYWCCSSVFIVNSEQVSCIFLLFSLWTLNK